MSRKFIKEKLSVVGVLMDQLLSRLDQRQRQISNFLNKKCKHFSPRQLTIGLVIFCLVFGCSIFFTIWNSLESYAAKKSSLQIQIPRHAIIHDSGRRSINNVKLLEKIHRQVDSIGKTKEGKLLLDKFKDSYPGLLDSLQQLNSIKIREYEK